MTAQELNILFGENVKYYRRKKGWKQKKLAEEIGVDNGIVCDYEKGRKMPRCRVLVLLAFVLGVEVYKLFQNDGGIK